MKSYQICIKIHSAINCFFIPAKATSRMNAPATRIHCYCSLLWKLPAQRLGHMTILSTLPHRHDQVERSKISFNATTTATPAAPHIQMLHHALSSHASPQLYPFRLCRVTLDVVMYTQFTVAADCVGSAD